MERLYKWRSEVFLSSDSVLSIKYGALHIYEQDSTRCGLRHPKNHSQKLILLYQVCHASREPPIYNTNYITFKGSHTSP